MKKLINILGIVTITSSAIPAVIAAAPYQPEEKILNRSKRGGEVQGIQIVQQGRDAELAYQKAGEEFQRNQNHDDFSQAQKNFLQAQKEFVNSQNEGQQGLTQGANEIKNERNQQGGNEQENTEAEEQGIEQKVYQLNNKIGVNILDSSYDVDQIYSGETGALIAPAPKRIKYPGYKRTKTQKIVDGFKKADEVVQHVSVWVEVIDKIKDGVIPVLSSIFKVF